MGLRPEALPTLVCLLWAAAAADAAQRPEIVIPVGTERVLVDLVVRDKQGTLIRDLRPEELELREDGVRQQVESLELVRFASGDGAAAPPLLALVFDRLGPAARGFAAEAALEFLRRETSGELLVGAFTIDRGLAPLEPFTADMARVARALETMTRRGATTLAGKRERELTLNAHHGLGEGLGQAHVAAAESRGAPECRGREEVRIRLAELLDSRLVEGFASAERDQQGFDSTRALISLVETLAAAPGRKAVLLFSEGLAVPANVEATYRAVIASANRARVSLYTVDSGGLRVESPGDEVRRTLDNIRTRVRSSEDGGRLTDDDPLALMERNEGALRLTPASTLVPLAQQTAGFAIGATNDVREELQRLHDELREHYLVSYTPRNAALDGRFRRIEVKLRRPHGSLQARKGYLAKRADPAVRVDEPSLLARLESGRTAAELPVRVHALQFPDEAGLARVPLLVEVAGGRLAAGVQRATSRCAVLAIVRDGSGKVVARVSGLAGRLAAAEGERPLLFQREVRLPPGAYAIETIALDAVSGTTGVARTTLDVPAASRDRLRASSVVLVGGVAKAPGGAGRGPLVYDELILQPDLQPRLHRDSGRPLTFFFSAWPAPGQAAVDAHVELHREGRRVAKAPPFRVLRSDPDGRAAAVSTVSVDSLLPGEYELRLTLTDGSHTEERSTEFAIGE